MHITQQILAVIILLHGFIVNARPVLGPRLASPATRLSEKIDNHTYVLKPFSEEDQGSYSETYEIKGGFKTNSEDGVPAVLKIIKKVGLGIGPRREMCYLHLVNLLLHAEASKSSFFIVMKDVRVDFPNKGDPPLKLFHEWYLDDRDMIAEEGLVELRKIVKTRLRGFAHDEKINLLYSDFHLLNLYMDEKLEYVMPIDWGPATRDKDGKVLTGVIEVREGGKKDRESEIKLWESTLDKRLEKELSVGMLRAVLKSRQRLLRPFDEASYLETHTLKDGSSM